MPTVTIEESQNTLTDKQVYGFNPREQPREHFLLGSFTLALSTRQERRLQYQLDASERIPLASPLFERGPARWRVGLLSSVRHPSV